MLVFDNWTGRRMIVPLSHDMIRRRGNVDRDVREHAWSSSLRYILIGPIDDRTCHPNATCTQQQSSKHYRTNLLRPSASNSKQRVIIASTTYTDDVSNQPHAISVANLRLHKWTGKSAHFHFVPPATFVRAPCGPCALLLLLQAPVLR